MTREERILRGMRVVRLGHGANCSSIGSVVDTLFASAVVGSAILTAIAAAVARESPRADPGERSPPPPERLPPPPPRWAPPPRGGWGGGCGPTAPGDELTRPLDAARGERRTPDA